MLPACVQAQVGNALLKQQGRHFPVLIEQVLRWHALRYLHSTLRLNMCSRHIFWAWQAASGGISYKLHLAGRRLAAPAITGAMLMQPAVFRGCMDSAKAS